MQIDFQTYSLFSSSILEEGCVTLATKPNFYSQYSFGFYFIMIIYEFVLSIFIILKANSPIRDVAFQVGKTVLRAVGSASAAAVTYSHLPVEPNAVSNYVHTKTPFGRGCDDGHWKRRFESEGRFRVGCSWE